MKSENLVKKDLLRRKVYEHFNKNPKSKTIIVKADIGECKTVWKVNRVKEGFRIVEVNTKREEFLVEAPPGSATLGPGGSARVGGARPGAPGQTRITTDPKVAKQQMAQIIAQADARTWGDPQGRAAMLMQYNQLAGIMDTQAAKAFKDLLSSMGISETEFDKAESGQFGAVPGMPAGGQIKAHRIREVENEEDPKKLKKKTPDEKKPEKPKEDPKIPKISEPAMSDIPPEDTSIETDADITEPSETPPTEEPGQEEPGQELSGKIQLQQILKSAGPVNDIHFRTDESGVHFMTLDFVGKKNNVEVTILPSGRITYKFGDQPPKVVQTTRGAE